MHCQQLFASKAKFAKFKLKPSCAMQEIVEIHDKDKTMRHSRESTAKYSKRTGHFHGNYRSVRDYGKVWVTVTGNCCWRYYGRPGFRGKSVLVRPGERRPVIAPARSVRLDRDC